MRTSETAEEPRRRAPGQNQATAFAEARPGGELVQPTREQRGVVVLGWSATPPHASRSRSTAVPPPPSVGPEALHTGRHPDAEVEPFELVTIVGKLGHLRPESEPRCALTVRNTVATLSSFDVVRRRPHRRAPGSTRRTRGRRRGARADGRLEHPGSLDDLLVSWVRRHHRPRPVVGQECASLPVLPGVPERSRTSGFAAGRGARSPCRARSRVIARACAHAGSGPDSLPGFSTGPRPEEESVPDEPAQRSSSADDRGAGRRFVAGRVRRPRPGSRSQGEYYSELRGSARSKLMIYDC